MGRMGLAFFLKTTFILKSLSILFLQKESNMFRFLHKFFNAERFEPLADRCTQPTELFGADFLCGLTSSSEPISSFLTLDSRIWRHDFRIRVDVEVLLFFVIVGIQKDGVTFRFSAEDDQGLVFSGRKI